MALESIARVRLAALPTPLDEAPRLTEALGGARILVKRDDLTGLAFGGNKVRKLEFLMAEALGQGADVIVTQGPVQSNHCRQTAAAACRLGLRCVLVMNRAREVVEQGNLLIDHLLGAETRIIDLRPGYSREDAVAETVADLRASGARPYVIPTGGSSGVGALGYTLFVHELQTQLFDRGLSVDRLYVSSGSGGTQGGLVLGARLFGAEWRIVGVSPGDPIDHLLEAGVRDANEGAQLLGRDMNFTNNDFSIDAAFGGAGYESATPESEEAIRLFAQTEAIILDPVYTAKAAAALISHVRDGTLSRDANVVFLHTGGTPAIFAFPLGQPAKAPARP